MRASGKNLGDNRNIRRIPQFDGRPQAGQTGADNQNIMFDDHISLLFLLYEVRSTHSTIFHEFPIIIEVPATFFSFNNIMCNM